MWGHSPADDCVHLEVKDTLTLLLFYLVVICRAVYYLWEMYFSGRGWEMTWLWFRAAGGSLHPSERQNTAGTRHRAQGRHRAI